MGTRGYWGVGVVVGMAIGAYRGRVRGVVVGLSPECTRMKKNPCKPKFTGRAVVANVGCVV